MAATVSEHRKGDQFSGFKKMIGGHRFYFGEAWGIFKPTNDAKKLAIKAAGLLEREFDTLRLTDGGWTATNRPPAINRVRAILGLAGELTPTQMPPKAPEPASVAGNATGNGPALTVGQAIEAYKAAQGERFATRQIGEGRYESIRERIEIAKAAFPSLEVPLVSLRREQAEALVNHWLKRPVSERTGKPISPITVSHQVGALGHFFRWAYDNEKWDGFRGWENVFSVDTASLMTAEEKHKAKQPKPKFTVDELAILYANASPRTRLYMLVALNTGMGQNEIATLRTWDLLLDNKPPIIDRDRHKTGVQGRWELWEETAHALRRVSNPYSAWAEAIANQSPEYKRPSAYPTGETNNKGINADEWASLVVRTEDGYPLVHGKTDAVRLAWDRLYKRPAVKAAIERHKLRRLSFYSVRRTAAQFIRDIAGYETHKIFLAHASLEQSGSMSVSEKHYTSRSNADFAKVADATRKFREVLQPMFDAKAEETKKEVKAKRTKVGSA